MANNPQITVEITPSLATTTDGTSTVTVLSVPFHDTTGGESITFDVVGYDISNNDIATAKVFVRVTNTSGTLAMVGTPVHLVPIQVGSSTALQSASVNVVVSGSNVNVNVIGVTGKTIKWVAYRNPAVEVLNSWTAVTSPEDGYINSWEASNTRWNPISRAALINGLSVGGDLSGTLPNPTVIKINGTSVPASPSSGQILAATGSSSSTWQSLSGDVSGTISATTVGKLQNRTVASTAPTNQYVLTWNAGANQWEPSTPLSGPPSGAASGDLTDTYPNPTVAKIRGKTLDSGLASIGASQDGYILTWVNGNSDWEAKPNSLILSSVSAGGDLSGTYPNPIVTTVTGVNSGGNDMLYGGIVNTNDAFNIAPRTPTSSHAGKHMVISGGSGFTSSENSGSVYIIGGASGGTGANGNVIIDGGGANAGIIIGNTPSGGTQSVSVGAPSGTSLITIRGSDLTLGFPTSNTVGAAGGASALPATPSGYLVVTIGPQGGGGTAYKIPYYAT